AAAFVCIFFFKISFPLIILSAGLIGLIGGWLLPSQFHSSNPHAVASASVIDDHSESPAHTKPSLRRAAIVICTCVAIWFAPLVAIGLWKGKEHTLFREGVFFSKAAMVTIGGAYAVLPYVSQQAVDRFHWLHAGQMMDGLGLAE